MRNHLHLLALLRLAYERLDLQAELRLIESYHRASSDAVVTERVHDIIAAEGAETIVPELAPTISPPGRR